MSWNRNGFQEHSYPTLCQLSIMTQRKSQRSYHDMSVSCDTQHQNYVGSGRETWFEMAFPFLLEDV